MSGFDLHAELVNLLNKTGKFHFERAAKAVKLLNDKDWVEAEEGGGGDESTALTRLEADAFADICSPEFQLSLLTTLYRNFPNIKDWEKHKFNFRKMYAEWSASKQGSSTNQRKKVQRAPNHPKEILTPEEVDELTSLSEVKRQYRKLYNRTKRFFLNSVA